MENIEVTVLMPVYNGEKYLRQAVDSILNQTFTDFEFLIVNDGSTDSTRAILESYSDNRIQVINTENGGVVKALNLGLQRAKGTYIARMDADDISYPQRLQLQYDFMKENPDYGAVGADVNWITEDGDFLFEQINSSHTYEEIQQTYKTEIPFVHSVIFMKKSFVIECGCYPELLNFEDYGLWVKFVEKGKVCNLDMILEDCRLNPSSVSIDERDLGETFTRIKKKALDTGHITEEEKEELKACIQRFSKKQKLISYHRMVGKKYLWNNYQPKKARKHLAIALRSEPFHFITIALFGLSFFPKSVILKAYKFMKN